MSTSNRAEGAAQVAAGGAALGVGLSTGRIVNAVERRGLAEIKRQQEKARLKVGDPVVRTIVGASAGAKQKAKIATRQNFGQLQAINAKANRARRMLKPVTGAKARGALLTAGFAASAPNIWLGSRKVVEKRADKHDVDAFMAGALGGAGAYHAGLYGTKPIDRRIDRMVSADKDNNKTLRAHQKAVGLPKNAPKGDPRWLKYHREYPKSIPGAKWKRTMSRLQGGKTQVAITAGIAGAAGLGAAAANRKIHPVSERGVKKAFTGRLVPKSMLMRKPGVRRSYIGTSVTGRKFTVRGTTR